MSPLKANSYSGHAIPRAQHAVVAGNVADGTAAVKMKPGAKRRVNVVVGIACDGGVIELNADAVPGIDAMPAVARDGDVVKMSGTVIRYLDTVVTVVFYTARGKPECGIRCIVPAFDGLDRL